MRDFARIRWGRACLLGLAAVTFSFGIAGCGAGDGERDDEAGDGASRSAPPRTPRKAPALELVQVARFNKPVHVVPVPGTDLAAVVEKGGRVIVVSGIVCARRDSCPAEPVTAGDVIVDLRGEVSTGSEQGLLGMAFHPKWPDDPRFFLNYTDRKGDTRVEAWELDAPTGPARRARELLRIDQPFANHNGGHLAFGPDGLLYVGTGDGGSAGDPGDRAQQPDELLGKLLRLDVDRGEARGYAIPDGNLDEGAPQVWAVGLRNPWRFSFDAETGDLWIGDVGQNEREEINVLSRDQLDARTPNFEWRLREGFRPFDRSGVTGPGRMVSPALDYGRDEGCSVTGGVVYRGSLVPSLQGWYLFADYCAEDLRLLYGDGVPGTSRSRGELTWNRTGGVAQTVSFAQVQGDEVLVVSLEGGIHQIVAPS